MRDLIDRLPGSKIREASARAGRAHHGDPRVAGGEERRLELGLALGL